MASFVGRHSLHKLRTIHFVISRSKATSAQYVASRARDPTFEKLMGQYKNLIKFFSIQDLILASPNLSVPLPYLSRLSQTLHLNRGAASFIQKYPHIFEISCDQVSFKPIVKLTQSAFQISHEESLAAAAMIPETVSRLICLLSMSSSKCLPLRTIFRIWRELGLPDDFEDSVILQNKEIFTLCDNPHVRNTHILKLVPQSSVFKPVVENWRQKEISKENVNVEASEIQFGFKHNHPPGMKLSKDYRAWLRKWQKLPYVGPYESNGRVKKTKNGMKRLEKRAVGIVHEFLSLMVEKMVEVEKISHFKKWFEIDVNIRDLFLDHPGIFYLSTKGKRHTVFLREAYDRGCLIEPNSIYDARRKLLHLISLGRRGLSMNNMELGSARKTEDEDDEEEESQEDDEDQESHVEDNL
ncbi:protein ROOT PRIMORDIUM DEFECTIVE 1 [Aristolochia californica]|uniref:protein ROOT PRIMORDIUM DEFECTIVE 1 n=1 Tax=Aristolochia californica TaxID=171875 RepID=UPI0035D880F3